MAMMEEDVTTWLKSIEPMPDEEADPALHPNNTYSRFASERSFYRRGNTIYFQGAGTRGEVCARRTSLYSFAEEDFVSRTQPQNCNDNSDRTVEITYRVAGLVSANAGDRTDDEVREYLKRVPSSSHSGTWPGDEGYVNYDTLSRVGSLFRGRFAKTFEEACAGTTEFSTMPDDRSWRTPIEGSSCEDGRLILHAVLNE
jgi:hypothetical protein